MNHVFVCPKIVETLNTDTNTRTQYTVTAKNIENLSKKNLKKYENNLGKAQVNNSESSCKKTKAILQLVEYKKLINK